MDVDSKSTAGSSQYQNKACYFCSPGCSKQIDENPQKYESETWS